MIINLGMKMKKFDLIEKNIQIHNNLWKVYSISLSAGILLLLVKGII